MKQAFFATLIISALISVTATSTFAETRAQFCKRWHSVCERCEGLGARVPQHECFTGALRGASQRTRP